MNGISDSNDLTNITTSFERQEISMVAPTTESQLEIWLSCTMGGTEANRSYNQFTSALLTGPFNKEAMLHALQDLVNMHQSFRMSFSDDGKNIIVYEEVILDVDYRDLSSQTTDQQQQFIKNHSKQNILISFDLLKAPLFKASLFKLSENEHYLTMVTHHIICDGWSLGIMLQDLGKLYSSYAKNEAADFQDIPLFTDYALEQEALTKSQINEENELYWLQEFKGSDYLLNVPVDYPRPAIHTYKCHQDDFVLQGALVNDLKKLAKSAGSSYAITLLAAFEIFLHQVTGQDEIILGLPSAGQPATDNFRLIGHCVNLLALRSRPEDDVSFKTYLKQRRTAILDAYDHQMYSFGNLLNKLQIPRDISRPPLVPVVFNIETELGTYVEFHELTHKLIPTPKEYENFEIFLGIDNHEDKLTFKWKYNTQIFKPSTIKQMMDGFAFLLGELIKSPETLIGNIPRLNAGELSGQLAGWNNTKYAYPMHLALHELISQRAAESPDKTAITFGEQKTTYKILHEQANQLAAILIKNDVKKGDRVALALDRSAEMVIALLAIMKTGAVYIPLDPQFPLNRINYMLEDSKAVILLTSKKYKNHFQSQAKELLIEDLSETLHNYPSTDPDVEVNGHDLVYILYTSGSTGMPKGAQIAHHNLVNFLISMQREPGLTATDKLLAVTTISFDIAGLELYLPLLTGAEIIVADSKAAIDGRALLDIIKKEKVNVMQATPYTWRLLLEAGWDESTPLKVICGGEALPLELSQKLLKRASSLWNAYGPTETTIWSTVKKLTSEDEVISIGRPINNTSIYILDKFLNPLAPGIPGEIYIGGDGVAKGYLNRPELTAEKFVDDPFSKHAGNKMYRTGDLGKFMPDGEIECLGRMDAQVKIRGYRIETGEVEYQLAKENDIKHAVVIARTDKFGVDKLVAFIVTANIGEPLNTTALIHNWKAGLKNSLPDYMVPDNFIIVPAMPLTPNGKIDKKALPDPETRETVKLYTGPRNETETMLAGIWRELLGLQQIGIYDNFFDLGGHSLLALRVIASVENVTSKRLPVSVLFEYPTIEKFAKFLEEVEGKSKLQSLVPIKATGGNKPLYVVSGINGTAFAFVQFANMFDAEQPVYLLQEPQEIGEMEEFPDNVEGIAATYIDQILKQNPDGPFALAGHCFGGIIAFEMAKQMEKMGKEVKLLALIDITISDFETMQPGIKKNLYFIKKTIQSEFYKIYKNISLLAENRTLFLKYRKQSSVRLLNKIKRVAKPNHNIEEYDFSQKVTQLYEKARKNYQFTPYNKDVIIFRAKMASYHRDDKKFSGWKPFVNSIEVRDVEGDHLTMLDSMDLAAVLQTDLNLHLNDK